MYKETDFQLSQKEFSFKKDSYPLSKINDVRVKKLGLLDNVGQIIFWLFVFSGAVWLAVPSLESTPTHTPNTKKPAIYANINGRLYTLVELVSS